MENTLPSQTYQLLYYEIIDELFAAICNSKENYCIRSSINNMNIQTAMWYKFEEYRSKILPYMTGSRLDRHKLSSSMCGAIIETKPLVGFRGAQIPINANEILALCVGLNIIKYYMMFDLLHGLQLPEEKMDIIKKHLKNHFDMQLPPLESNICDTQEYGKNISNALYWSHHYCNFLRGECYHYDLWAYAKIFYHLEVYNEPLIKKEFEQILKTL